MIFKGTIFFQDISNNCYNFINLNKSSKFLWLLIQENVTLMEKLGCYICDGFELRRSGMNTDTVYVYAAIIVVVTNYVNLSIVSDFMPFMGPVIWEIKIFYSILQVVIYMQIDSTPSTFFFLKNKLYFYNCTCCNRLLNHLQIFGLLVSFFNKGSNDCYHQASNSNYRLSLALN